MNELRVVVIASKDKSDLYFANQLTKRLNVIGVVVENQLHKQDYTSKSNKATKLLAQPHVLIAKIFKRIINKIRFKYAIYNKPGNTVDFGEQGLKLLPDNNCAVLYTTGVNDINNPNNIEWIKKTNPDVIAVCGASIFKEEILTVPKKGVLNLHGGLSQKYRGLCTTDWAVCNEEPEYVGATVHFVSTGIDDGDIVYQGRPNIALDDNPNSLYVKVVKLGVDMMVQAINDIQNENLKSIRLAKKGDLYLGSMFDLKMRESTWKKVRKGVIKNYLSNKQARDDKVLAEMINIFPSSK